MVSIPFVISHRGANQLAPENTLAAFHKAAELGVQWIEFDVALSKDNVPVVIHDDTLERTTNGRGKVSNHTFAELKSLDAGSWFSPEYTGTQIPSLVEVLQFCQQYRLGMNIEIKSLKKNMNVAVKTILQVVKPYCLPNYSNVIFSSFSIPVMKALRKADSMLPMGLLLSYKRIDWRLLAQRLRCDHIHLANTLVTPEFVQKIHRTGRKVLSYTVNDVEMMQKFRQIGVDAVFTDNLSSGHFTD